MRELNKWRKEAGVKPSKKLLQEAATLARVATADHVVVAMALRKQGVTQREVMALFGHPHRNKLKRLLQEQRVKCFLLPDKSKSQRIRVVKN